MKKIYLPSIGFIFILISSLFVLVPFLWMISTSLKDISETFSLIPRLIPENITLKAYSNVLSKTLFGNYISNSLIVVILSTVITVSFATLAGYGMSRFKFRNLSALTTFLLLTQMFPSVLLLIPIFQVLSTTQLIDTYAGLTFVYIGLQLPLCTWLMIGFFNSIPKELDYAASIDGLPPIAIFLKIMLPLSLPGIASTFLYAFFNSWNEYMFAKILMISNNKIMLPVGIGQLVGQYNIQWNELMAASLMGSIPLFFIFIFMQKYFVAGLISGSVKE